MNFIRREKYFFLTLLLIGLMRVLLFGRGSLLLTPEIWAETGTNFIYHSLWTPWTQSLWIHDAGYWPLFLRLSSMLLTGLTPEAGFLPGIYQAFGFLIICLSLSCFSLSFYRRLETSDLTRILVCLLFSLHFNYELHTFINSPYYLLFPLLFFLTIWIRHEPIPQSVVLFHMLLMALAILSKPVFLAYGVLFLMATVIRWRNTGQFHWLSLIVPAMTMGLQTLFTLQNIQSVPTAQGPYSLWWTYLIYPLSLVQQTMTGKPLPLNFQNLGITALVFVFLIWKYRPLSHLSRSTWDLCGLAILGILANMAMNLRGVSALYGLNFPSLPSTELLMNRQWFFAVVLTLWALLGLFKEFLKTGFRYRVVIVLIALFSGFFQIRNLRYEEPGLGPLGFSNARQDASKLSDETACIPVNPVGWYYFKNCRILNTESPPRDLANLEWKQAENPVTLPPSDGSVIIRLGLLLDLKADSAPLEFRLLNENGETVASIRVQPAFPFRRFYFVDLPTSPEKPAALAFASPQSLAYRGEKPQVILLGR